MIVGVVLVGAGVLIVVLVLFFCKKRCEEKSEVPEKPGAKIPEASGVVDPVQPESINVIVS